MYCKHILGGHSPVPKLWPGVVQSAALRPPWCSVIRVLATRFKFVGNLMGQQTFLFFPGYPMA